MKAKTGAYTATLVAFLAGSAAAGPLHAQAAAPYDISTSCATATNTTPTTLGSPYMTLVGVATNAAPASLLTSLGLTTGTAAVTTTTTMTSTSTTSAPVTFATPQEFGFLSYVGGLSPVFQPGTFNASTALFTFNANAATSTDSALSMFPATTRTGTFTIYLANGIAGNFNNLSSFTSGTPVLTGSYTQQSYLNLAGQDLSSFSPGVPASRRPKLFGLNFISQSQITVASVKPFSLGGSCYQLGTVGQTLTLTSSGQITDQNGLSGGFTGAIFQSAGTTKATSAAS